MGFNSVFKGLNYLSNDLRSFKIVSLRLDPPNMNQ